MTPFNLPLNSRLQAEDDKKAKVVFFFPDGEEDRSFNRIPLKPRHNMIKGDPYGKKG